MSKEISDKKSIIDAYGAHPSDSGSPSVQIALLTSRIAYLSSHLSLHSGDLHAKRSLIQLVTMRSRFLKYLKRVNHASYTDVVARLGIRVKNKDKS